MVETGHLRNVEHFQRIIAAVQVMAEYIYRSPRHQAGVVANAAE